MLIVILLLILGTAMVYISKFDMLVSVFRVMLLTKFHFSTLLLAH
jgi:hypothetical protein